MSMAEVHEGTEEHEHPWQGLDDVSPVLGQEEVECDSQKDHEGDPGARAQPAPEGSAEGRLSISKLPPYIL